MCVRGICCRGDLYIQYIVLYRNDGTIFAMTIFWVIIYNIKMVH